jgi:hypothetical protein
VKILPRALIAVALVVVPTVGTRTLAQGQTVAALHVSARVKPICSIIANAPASNAARSVRVVCAQSGLRALRVSVGAGDEVAPRAVADAHPMLSGGTVVYTVPIPLAPLITVASLRPMAYVSRTPQPPAAVVVTLDF